MGVFSPAGAPSPAGVTSTGSKAVCGVQNETITFAATEKVIVLPDGLKAFKLKARGMARLQISCSVGESDTNYFTLPCGTVLMEEGLNQINSYTLYIQSNKAGTEIEILHWT